LSESRQVSVVQADPSVQSPLLVQQFEMAGCEHVCVPKSQESAVQEFASAQLASLTQQSEMVA
jgi:hypothetical protein